MSKTAIVWSCAHAKPEASNERFDWLGQLIYDIRPDYCKKMSPSIDRKDTSKGYILGNIQWITHSENSSKGGINRWSNG